MRIAGLFLLALGACGGPTVSSGTMECLICGRSEEHRWVGDRLDRTEPNPDGEFTRWYNENVGAVHDHDWEPTGCHFSGNIVACLPRGDSAPAYHREILNLPDIESARRWVRDILAATPEQRRAALATGRPRLSFDSPPWRAIRAAGHE